MPRLSTVLWWLFIAFIIWFILTQPAGAANLAHSIGHLFTRAANGLASFANHLTA